VELGDLVKTTFADVVIAPYIVGVEISRPLV
jgi:hypothetical protein